MTPAKTATAKKPDDIISINHGELDEKVEEIKNVGGRPKKEIDWREFEQLCFLQCTIDEICQWFHISDKTIERRVKEHYGEGFSAVFAKKRVNGLISLRRNMMRQAERNPAVAIFLAKNWLGMADHMTLEGGEKPIQHGINVNVVSEAAAVSIKAVIAGKGLTAPDMP